MDKEMFGKVVEVKKPFSIYYSVYYYAPFSGGNEIEAEPGTRFKIVGAWGEDAYECSAEDRAFEKKAEKAELKKVKPFIRMKFGHIEGFQLPVSLLEDGTVEVVSAAELEAAEVPSGKESNGGEESDNETDIEDFFAGEGEEDEEEREEMVYGYPAGYAQGTPNGEYCVIDLSPSAEGGDGPLKYPVSFMDKMPEGGWTDEYKTTKIVLKLVRGGDFTMGTEKNEEICAVNPPHKVKLPNDFYIGVFPVTRRQYELIGGFKLDSKWPSDDDGKQPVYNIPYIEIRGTMDGVGWPEDADVDGDSFLGALRERTGIENIDLPTAAQWEYACRAGEGETDDGDLRERAWIKENGGERVHPVGLLRPNKWGLYDMLGNVWEWCLDWYGSVKPDPIDYDILADEEGVVESPAGKMPEFRGVPFPFMSPLGCNAREIRGCGWNVDEKDCNASTRGGSGPSRGYDFVGFRLAIALAAKNARNR